MKRPLRAITVWQCWAGLLATGTKTVENRTWAPRQDELRVGEHVAIHAGTRYDEDSWDVCGMLKRELAPLGRWKSTEGAPWPLRSGKPNPDAEPDGQTPYGAIIGVAVLDEIRREPRSFRDDHGEYADPWWCGPYGWYLRDAVAIPAVWCGGARRLWLVEGRVLDDVRERYRAARG